MVEGGLFFAFGAQDHTDHGFTIQLHFFPEGGQKVFGKGNGLQQFVVRPVRNQDLVQHNHDGPVGHQTHLQLLSSTTVAPAPPSFCGGSATVATCGWSFKNCRSALRRIPMPLPWTIRTRVSPARNARSRNFSTSLVAWSTVWPITLISIGMLGSSLTDTEMPFDRAAASGEGALRDTAGAKTSATSSRGTRIFIFMVPTSTSSVFSSILRRTMAVCPSDFSFTVSPSETRLTS